MTKILSTTFALVFLLSVHLHAQEQTISGKVTDEDGKTPLPGVNVLIKDTNTGTITDVEGNYNLQVVDNDATLVFSFIGYKTQEVPIGNQTIMNITMTPDISQLEELVVIGFGQKKKKDLTGSIAIVDAEEIEKITTASPQFALQGNAAGVRVVNTSGNPNEAPKIYVRGIGTWNGDSQPLYVVDGQIIVPPHVPVGANEDVIGAGGLSTPPNLFNLINPNDIASITVLKDASAAAVYGSRGANGVVLITTKRGKLGAPVVEFNARTSIQSYPSFDMLNTQQYVALAHQMYANNLNPDNIIERDLYGRNSPADSTRLLAYSPQFDPQSPFYLGGAPTYDWQDALMNEGAINQAYDVKFSGATGRVNYFVSGGYFNQEGMIKGDELTRYTAAINLDTKVADWMKLGINYKYSHQLSEMNNRGGLQELAEAAPWQPLYDPANEHGFAPAISPFGYSNTWQPARLYGAGTNNNFAALSEIEHRDLLFTRQLAQAFVEFTPLEGLSLRGSLNFDYATQDRFALNPWAEANIFKASGTDPRLENPITPSSPGGLTHRINKILNYQSDFTINYSRTIADKHNLSLTAAVQDIRYSRENQDITTDVLNKINFEKPRRNYIPNSSANTETWSGRDQKYWFGVVGRLSYNFNSKYYLDATVRRDASNGFPDEYQWGTFPSLSAAWRISDEPFMENIAFLNDLKIRGGWGQAGNDQAAVGLYAYIPTVAGHLTSYSFGSGNGDAFGTYTLGAWADKFPNRSVQWEVVTTSYIGFDAYLFQNRLNMSVEVYDRTTDGILQSVYLPLTVPTSDKGRPVFNIGKLQNRGVDLQMGYQNIIGEFSYGISGNISILSNEVLDLYNDQPFSLDGGGQFAERADDAWIEEGRSVGVIWGYQVGGIFQNQEEIDAYFERIDVEGVNPDYVAPGDMYFVDVHGRPTEEHPFYSPDPDGAITSEDRTVIGNSIPGYTYGINLNAAWKGFDVSMNFYGEGDVDRYNAVKARFEGVSGVGSNYSTAVLDAWTPQNTSTDIPRVVVDDPAGNNRFSNRWVESAAFFRLNNWQVGYSLPASVLEVLKHVQSLRIYVGGQNNVYLTNWSGIDPVNDAYPLPRTFTAGLNVKF